MKRRRLNEERGARRAAELKRRFRAVSERSLKRGGNGFAVQKAWNRMPRAGAGRALVIWGVIGLVAYVIGAALA